MIYTVTLNPALDRELLVDAVRLGEVLRAKGRRDEAGGKGYNVSRALLALGKKSVSLGFLGGETGAHLGASIAQGGLDLVTIPIAGETRTNISLVGEVGESLKVNEPGPHILPGEWEGMLRQVESLAQTGDWWIFSGSLPEGLPATAYETLIQTVGARGARAILDTSGDALRHGCSAHPFLVKPNASEAREALGIGPSEPRGHEELSRGMISLGALGVFLTLGKNGALAMNAGETHFRSAPVIQERNATGAGDAALAGFVWALDEGRPWREALEWGIACGAAAAGKRGSGVGTRAEVEGVLGGMRATQRPSHP
ncbi:MAG: 1-phosphofructokinase family hexose kinase [Spirochaetes bacterium]|nr:1-phosphofructokinase family hexose kinase [Spirochaetota bacterium]